MRRNETAQILVTIRPNQVRIRLNGLSFARIKLPSGFPAALSVFLDLRRAIRRNPYNIPFAPITMHSIKCRPIRPFQKVLSKAIILHELIRPNQRFIRSNGLCDPCLLAPSKHLKVSKFARTLGITWKGFGTCVSSLIMVSKY